MEIESIQHGLLIKSKKVAVMTSVIKYYDGIDSVAVIGNYLPRQCGIATFTTDLVEGLSAEAPDIYCWAVAMNDKPEGYSYPEKVRFEINQNKLSDYSIASQFLNISQTDIVCVQHEYGLFGGPAGSHLLKLLANLRMPVVTTLHTVLQDPAPEYRAVMCKLSDLSDKLVVMSHKAADLLKDIYAVPEDKIVFIHHGIPDTPFIDPSFYKDKFGVEGKKVLLTFGLLSPNKGIENVLQALPEIIKKHPDVVYIILGATHPNILKLHGDEYRIMLQQLVGSAYVFWATALLAVLAVVEGILRTDLSQPMLAVIPLLAVVPLHAPDVMARIETALKGTPAA